METVSEVRFSESKRVLTHRGKLTDDFFARVEKAVKSETEKPVYKEKLRVRSYGTVEADGTAFVEIKKKFKLVI